MGEGSVLQAIAEMRAAYAKVCTASVASLPQQDLLRALGELEALSRQMAAQSHRLLTCLQREASPVECGAKSWPQVLTDRLHLSSKDARRRLEDAKDLGPRTSLSGQHLAPVLARVAAAQAGGRIGVEHVAVIREFFTLVPDWVDLATCEQLEDSLVAIAAGSTPEGVRAAGKELLAYLDQDGPVPDEAQRSRQRAVHLGPQQANGLSRLTGWVDPQGRATLEPVLGVLGGPGMCNPADEHPCTRGTPSQGQIDGDQRSVGQRQHDALIALARIALSSGELGQHHGLPVSVVVTTTLQDLEAAAGSGVTAGGSRVPMADLIRMASHAHHYLAVFDQHTAEVLYCGRSKRIAPAAHRIVLFARDRGCTKPGCRVPAYGTQVHHTRGWAKGGLTNIDEEVLACGPDNRLAEDGWTVRQTPEGVEWIPPPHLDHGQPRINYCHHPERLLNPALHSGGQGEPPPGPEPPRDVEPPPGVPPGAGPEPAVDAEREDELRREPAPADEPEPAADAEREDELRREPEPAVQPEPASEPEPKEPPERAEEPDSQRDSAPAVEPERDVEPHQPVEDREPEADAEHHPVSEPEPDVEPTSDPNGESANTFHSDPEAAPEPEEPAPD